MPKGKGYLATLTPEQRKEMQAKASATRAAKKAAAGASPVDHTPTLDELLPAPASDFVDDILTPEELAEIRAQAKKKVSDDRKRLAKQAYLEEAIEHERRAQGDFSEEELLSAEMREEVRVYINLPALRTPTGSEIPPDPIIINQHVYHHNTWHTVERHVAEFLHAQMAGAFRHVAQVDGRSRNYYNRQLGTVIYQGGIAAGTGGAGPSFEAIHRRPQ